MQISTLLTALFVASAVGSPYDKRSQVQGNPEVVEVTIIDEIDYYDGGELVSSVVHTIHTEETIYPEATSVSSAVYSPPAPSATVPASSSTPSPKPAPTPATVAPQPASVAASAAPSVQASNALTPGWVDPKADPKTFAAISVYHHNVHRNNHSAPAVVWNTTLATWAQAKADICLFNETPAPGAQGQGVGMNIAGGTYGYPRQVPGPSNMISDLWYNDELNFFPGYGEADLDTSGDLFEHWGHFTQLVWPTTVQIGCGITDCGNQWFGACLYGPAGNWMGEFNKINKPNGYPVVFPNGKTHW